MDDIDKQILDLLEKQKYVGPTPHQMWRAVEEGRAKISGFAGLPNKGKSITGPVQVYEDSAFWNAVRDSDS